MKYIEKFLQSKIKRGINMRNIINILKYDFGKYHTSKSVIFYVIGIIVVLFNSMGLFIKLPIAAQIISVLNVSFIVTFMVITFIWSIIRFKSQISKEKGRLIFTFPIKSHEFMIAKIIEFIIIQVIIVFLANIVSLISRNDFMNLISKTSMAVMLGTTVAYITIICFITIFLSYIKNTGLCVLAVIFGGGIIQTIIESVIDGIVSVFPYIYIKFGNLPAIDIIYSVINLTWLAFLVWLTIYHLDKKLDII